MIFRFYKDKQNTFVFQAPSCECAEHFLLKYCHGLSACSDDGCDWVGNYYSILSTVDYLSAYLPVFVVGEESDEI